MTTLAAYSAVLLLLALAWLGAPVNAQGSCIAHGVTDCSCSSNCDAGGCYCDPTCVSLGDCCNDFLLVCNPGGPQPILPGPVFSNSLYTYNAGSDSSYDGVDDGSRFVGSLTTPYILYGNSYSTVYVSSNGPVSFGTGTSSTSPSFPTTPPLVAAFWRDINPATGGVIYYRVINSGSELATLGESLRAVPGGSCLQFTPASAVVITFERVSAFGGSSSVYNTFQVVLMTDGSRSYTVFLYNSMNWGGSGAGIGFTDGSSFYTLAGGEGFSAFSAVASLPTASNVGVDGVYIFRTDSTAIQAGLEGCSLQSGFSSSLYTYNIGNDDSYDGVDDDSTFVGSLTTPYILYGNSYHDVYVGSNGPVSFGTGTSILSPSFPTFPALLAAFWRDINVNTGGVIYYRVINSGSELATLGESLRAVPGGSCLQFTPASAAVITFERVSAFGGSSSVHNTFQMVLMTNGSTSYTVFLYNSMNWGNSAGIGFTNGSSFYTLAGGEGVSTLSDVAFLPTASNVAVNGVYIFRTDSTTIQVGVQCTSVCTEGDIRLVDGNAHLEGRVEVCANNAWGTVCSNNWDTFDANVVCGQLGFLNAGATAYTLALFGPGTGPIHLDNLMCSGTEPRLVDCLHSGIGNTACSHFQDAGVRCLECTNGDIRLVDGANSTQGRVEVCRTNAWGTVCDDFWDDTDASVACRQLGFADQGAIARGSAFFGQGTGPINLDDLECNGSEERLIDCTFDPTHNCGHGEDAGVECVASAFDVLITTDPPAPPFPAATYIGLICNVSSSAVLPVTFEWTFHCSSTPNNVLQRFENFNDTHLGVVSVSTSSTPSSCHDTAICTVQDAVGTTVQATWLLQSVTGVGLFGTNVSLRNNSALVATSVGAIGQIRCHTSTMASSVGRWFGPPSGDDITFNLNDIFSVTFRQGANFYSYNRLQLQPSASFGIVDQGVYSCQIEDENGVEQTLHVGIYPSEYQRSIHITSVQRHTLSPLTVNCQTSGLPPTSTAWYSIALQSFLSDGAFHQMEQALTERRESEYSSFLSFSQNLDTVQGLYACVQVATIAGLGAAEDVSAINFFGLYQPGDIGGISCSVEAGETIEWFDTATSTVIHDQSILNFAFNDSIDGRLYMCNVYSLGLLVRQTNITTIVNVPDSAYRLTAAELSGVPATVGSSYEFSCTATKRLDGLINTTSVQWISPNGAPLMQGAGTTIVMAISSSGSSEARVSILALRTSHAGEYTCRGSLPSPALTFPLVKTVSFNITLQVPQPTVTLEAATSGIFQAGTTRTLNCEVAISSAVDTPVDATVTWSRGGVAITNGGRFTIAPVVPTSNSVFLSTLTVAGLRVGEDSGMYSCVASLSSASAHLTTSQQSTASLQITVQLLLLTVTTSPTSVRVLDISPHNTFTLTCSATTASSQTVPTTFQWSRRVSLSSSSTPLADNGGSVVITTTGQSSELTTFESVAGSYVYTCTGSVVGSSTSTSEESTVTVDGPTDPRQPTAITSTATSFTTATIEWDIPSTAYTPETYTVRYGTAQNLPSTNTAEVVVSGSQNVNEVGQHYSVELSSLDEDTTYYFRIVTENSAGSVTSPTQSFAIENIPLILVITETGSTTAGGTLTLTCTVTEEEDITGTPAVTWLNPAGQTISMGGDFTLTSQPAGLTTTLALQFSPLRASHAGQYTCRAEISEISYAESVSYTLDVFMTPFQVDISSSTQDFTAAMPLTLTCEATSGAVPPLTYSWSSTCSGECFIASQVTTSQISTPALRAADSGEYSCTAADSVGNIGTNVITVSTEGTGVYMTGRRALANNSVVQTNSIGNIDTIQCISGSSVANVGQVLGPSGQDIANSNLDPFEVTIGGANNPGHVEMSLAAGRLVSSDWIGVYTCTLPDESGATQTMFFGIYRSGVLPSIVGISLSANSIPTPDQTSIFLGLSLTCTSTGSAATAVSWRKDGELLLVVGGGGEFGFIQVLVDGATSTYENVLEVVNLDTSNGEYSCGVANDFGRVRQNVTHNGLQVARDPELFIVGQRASLTCTSDLDDLTSMEWLNRDGVMLASSENSQSVVLEFDPVNDSIHNLRYICRAVTPVGNQDQHDRILVEVDPASVSLAVTPPSTALPLDVPQFTLSCTLTVPPGLASEPSIKWFGPSGSILENSTDDGIYLTEETGRNTVTRNLTFNPRSLSDGMTFGLTLVCRAAVSSNALTQEIERQAEWDLIFAPVSETCHFQLLLGEVNSCDDWKFDDANGKIATIQQTLVRQCSCNELQLRSFLQSEFVCPDKNDRLVLFRAEIAAPCDGTTLSFLKDYVQGGTGSISIQGIRLQVFDGCPVEIDSLTAAKNCDRVQVENPDNQIDTGSSGTVIGAGAGGGIVGVVLLLVLAGVVIGCLRRRKKKRSQDLHPTEGFGMTSSNQGALSNPYYAGSLAMAPQDAHTITGANTFNPYELPPGHPADRPPDYANFDPSLSRQDSDYIKMGSVAGVVSPCELYDDTAAPQPRQKEAAEEVYDEIPATKADYEFYKNMAAVTDNSNVYANCN